MREELEMVRERVCVFFWGVDGIFPFLSFFY
jgi:hypothetical protein